jgi:hypothetical protein
VCFAPSLIPGAAGSKSRGSPVSDNLGTALRKCRQRACKDNPSPNCEVKCETPVHGNAQRKARVYGTKPSGLHLFLANSSYVCMRCTYKMSTRNFPGGKGRPAREADNLMAICEPIVYKM